MSEQHNPFPDPEDIDAAAARSLQQLALQADLEKLQQERTGRSRRDNAAVFAGAIIGNPVPTGRKPGMTARQVAEAILALPPEQQELPFVACLGWGAECDPEPVRGLYAQPATHLGAPTGKLEHIRPEQWA